MDSYYVRDVLINKLKNEYYDELDRYARAMDYTNGLADIVGPKLNRVESLSRVVIYVLMNKIVFYKILEGYYKLTPLQPFSSEVNSSEEYLKCLYSLREATIWRGLY